MTTATLIAHATGDEIVTRETLAQLPAPQSLGPRHVPIPHGELAEALVDSAHRHDYTVTSERWALAGEGARLFGVLVVAPRIDPDNRTLLNFPDELSMAIGIRHSNDKRMAIRLVTGAEVSVCTNLCMSGTDVDGIYRRLHTGRDPLNVVVDEALQRALDRYVTLNRQIEQMRETQLGTIHAKNLIYDVIVTGGLPAHLLPKVDAWYFGAPFAKELDPETMTDITPRSVWGVSNAFTRALREEELPRQLVTGQKVMKTIAALIGAN